MNWDTIEGSWTEMKGRAKQRWADISGDDWSRITGKRDEIAGLIQQKYGKAKDEAEREVDEWHRGL